MPIDAITILLKPSPTISSARTFRLLTGFCGRLGAGLDLTRMPSKVAQAIASGYEREKAQGLLDRLMPSRIDKTFALAADHMHEVARKLDPRGETTISFAPAARAFQLPVFQANGLTGAFLSSGPPPFSSDGLAAIFIDFRSFNRKADGLEALARIAVDALNCLGGGIGVGADPSFWRETAVRGDRFDALLSAVTSGRTRVPLILGHAPRAASGLRGYRKLATSSHLSAFILEESADVATASEPQSHESADPRPFAANWSGCSGRFAGEYEGEQNARIHYEKHVLQQAEWPPGEFAKVKDYVVSATALADRVDAVYELWQPANDTIVKYDDKNGELVIAGRKDQHLRTYFRPGSDAYVMRKLEAGLWQPPAIEDILPWESETESVATSEVKRWISEFRGLLDEADADTTACLIDIAELGHSVHLLPAIAWQAQLEFRLHRLRHCFLTDAEDAEVNELEEPIAELRAKVEVALDQLKPDPLAAVRDALLAAIAKYVAGIPSALVGDDAEEHEDLLFLRDQIGFAQSALRARSWLCELIDVLVFDSIWGDLAGADSILMVTLPKSGSGESIERYPETFFWRKQ